MREIIKPALILFLICVTTVMLLAGVRMMTQDTIDARAADDLEQAKRAVMPQAASFEDLPADRVAAILSGVPAGDYLSTIQQAYLARDSAGAYIGCVLRAKSRGYDASGVKMTIGIGADGSIVDIKVVEQAETPGLGTTVLDPAGPYMSQYRGLKPTAAINLVKASAAGPNDVQAVSGATITSRAIARAVEDGLEFSRALLATGVTQ